VRRRFVLFAGVVAALSAGSAMCQTAPATPVAPPAQAPAAPMPVPAAPGQTTGLPGYSQQPGTTQTVPAPVVKQPPVVAPAIPTQAAPYSALPPYIPYGIPDEDRKKVTYGSTYIPVDSWIYPAMTRLYSLGYANTMFLSLRPYTRQSLLHMMEATEDDVRDSDSEEAKEIYTAVMKELRQESATAGSDERGAVYGTESVYGRALGISGQTLRDSYHLGQTIVNDYGRPYEPGFNSLLGASTVAEYGRFSLYVRGEFQQSPSGVGYSPALRQYLSVYTDGIPYDVYNSVAIDLPYTQVAAADPFRLVEATLSFHVAGHEISGGKSDAWLGPMTGGAMAWSNNAENIYSFRINRVEPLHIPVLSWLIGPIRYDFFYGSLKGHTYPNDDWVHSEAVSARPSANFEFAFQRTIVFGGQGHEPVTLHTFLKGFFDLTDTTTAEKIGRDDPGARFSDFSMSYRLPFMRKYVTFAVDSIVHDDVTPPSAPRRAMFRTGLYLSQIPGARKFDFRFEAMDTDPITSRSTDGSFLYYEDVQRQAYTNKGFIMGDWIGREGKGGQAFLTYHLSGKEWLEAQFTNKKNDKDFIPGSPSATATDVYGNLSGFNAYGGTTQNSLKISAVKRFHHDAVELNAWFQYEKWKAPSYLPGPQSDTATAVQITFFPGLKARQMK